MKLASIALSLVVTLVCLVAVESASAQGFGYSFSWSSGGNCFPQQQYQTGYGYQRPCPPQYSPAFGYQRPCPPQFGANPYCPQRPVYGQQPMMPRCGNSPW